jgi:hypothetical protein
MQKMSKFYKNVSMRHKNYCTLSLQNEHLSLQNEHLNLQNEQLVLQNEQLI